MRDRTTGMRMMWRLLAAMAVFASVLAVGSGTASADTGGVVISELNYHAGSDLDTDDFLELVNTSRRAGRHVRVDVHRGDHGATLPSGSVIPAGGYFVVVTRRGALRDAVRHSRPTPSTPAS